jgi:hypothetical protein
MRLYTVHLPVHLMPTAGMPATDTAEQAVLVKEGFCWPALFVPLLWTLWHRMWWEALALLVFALAVGALDRLAGGALPALLGVALQLWFGLQGNDLRRWALARQGWPEVAVVGGNTRDAATRRYFDLATIGAA